MTHSIDVFTKTDLDLVQKLKERQTWLKYLCEFFEAPKNVACLA